MRNICLVAVLLALPLSASAQGRSGHARGGGAATTTQTTQQPGSIGLGLPAIGLPPATQQRPSSWNGQRQNPWWEHQAPPAWEQQQRTPTFDIRQIPGWTQGNVAKALLEQQHTKQQVEQQIRNGQVRPGHRARYYQPSVVYVLPTYGYAGLPVATTYENTSPPPPAYLAPTPVEPEPRVPLGALRLEVEPRENLQIFVDGVFIGTPADLGDDLEMVPGLRRIELRARGYKTQTFDVAILEDKLITYRGSMDRDPAAPQQTAAPIVRSASSRTIYVIPGCYMGNVSPTEMSLPAGCDINKLTTISP
ncbi:MAG: hypothetical protein ABI983_02440 [Acidobacteriota bacterium]